MSCTCLIVPRDILERLSEDRKLTDEIRQAAAATARLSSALRKLRTQAGKLIDVAQLVGGTPPALATAPAITVYDCKHTQTTPGTPVPDAGTAPDATARRAFEETTGVAKFYQEVFKRNSVDGNGMTLMSSIHYGAKFNNAMWNGSQMIYGDGDNEIFVDFTNGNDVIGHELTHGVTQYTLKLNYGGDAGGLNESISDCFGSMFRQWEADQDVKQADWLIGRDIMGPTAKSKGYTCLRDMARPAAKHCLAPQPTRYSQIKPGMDPHYSSGPPNLAFATACKAFGGKSWTTIGQVWYHALTGGASPNMKMSAFAKRTRTLAQTLYGSNPAVLAAVDKGWKRVGL